MFKLVFEFTKYVQVQVRVLHFQFFVFKFEFGKKDRVLQVGFRTPSQGQDQHHQIQYQDHKKTVLRPRPVLRPTSLKNIIYAILLSKLLNKYIRKRSIFFRV